MAEFLTTQGTLHQIENIITNAKNKLVLISPYLKLSKTLSERLKDADRQNVKIILIYGKDELKPRERNQLQELRNLSLYFFENLHAKCFFNEETMVITSMNMYDSSDEKNREMGVLIRKEDDNKVFSDAIKEAESIVYSSTKEDLRRSGSGYPRYRTKQTGYCIRCRTSIPCDLEKPLCPDCFSEWNFFGNPEYEERFCHTCGKPEATTMAKPQCYSCHNNS